MIKGSAGVLAAGDQFHAPAANTLATKTLAAPTEGCWVIGGIAYGFDVAPAASEEFTLESPATTDILLFPLGTAEIQELDFHPPLRFPMGEAVVIALTADSGGARGYVAFKSAWVE